MDNIQQTRLSKLPKQNTERPLTTLGTRKCMLKPHGTTTTHPPKWLKLKKMMSRVGENMSNRMHALLAGVKIGSII